MSTIRHKRAAQRNRRGFTILEVLIGVLVLSIGLIGILGMQSVAVMTNRANYDTRMATELAETTLEQLKRDALTWVTAGGWPPNSWLDRSMSIPGTWVTPPATGGGHAPVFNDLGVERDAVPGAIGERNSRYCVRYRTTLVGGATLARAEVDVAWPRNRTGEARLATDGCAGVLEGIEIANQQFNYHVVRVTGIVAQNSALVSQ